MNRIDTSNWGKFTIGEFFDIIPAKGKNSQKLISGNDCPYIAASKENNGFNKMVSKIGFEDWISKGNCITFVLIGDAAAGFAHYQSDDFIAMSGKISCGYVKNKILNKYSGTFIATILSKNHDKFSFNESWTGDRLLNTTFYLPVDTDGNPDWNYMEEYMKRIELISQLSLKLLKNTYIDNIKCDTSQWKSFKIGDVFKIKRPPARSQANYSEGDIPFVASGNYNNGVLKYLEPKKDEVLDRGNCISVSPVDGSAFYQEQDFLGRGGAGSSIILLYNDNLNKKNGIFIATIVKKVCSKYLYNNMGSKESISKEFIKLPIDSNGNPNWNYMSNYIDNLEKKELIILNKMKAII